MAELTRQNDNSKKREGQDWAGQRSTQGHDRASCCDSPSLAAGTLTCAAWGPVGEVTSCTTPPRSQHSGLEGGGGCTWLFSTTLLFSTFCGGPDWLTDVSLLHTTLLAGGSEALADSALCLTAVLSSFKLMSLTGCALCELFSSGETPLLADRSLLSDKSFTSAAFGEDKLPEFVSALSSRQSTWMPCVDNWDTAVSTDKTSASAFLSFIASASLLLVSTSSSQKSSEEELWWRLRGRQGQRSSTFSTILTCWAIRLKEGVRATLVSSICGVALANRNPLPPSSPGEPTMEPSPSEEAEERLLMLTLNSGIRSCSFSKTAKSWILIQSRSRSGTISPLMDRPRLRSGSSRRLGTEEPLSGSLPLPGFIRTNNDTGCMWKQKPDHS